MPTKRPAPKLAKPADTLPDGPGDFHIEFWRDPAAECERITIPAACWEHAKQTCIGRFNPVHLRRMAPTPAT